MPRTLAERRTVGDDRAVRRTPLGESRRLLVATLALVSAAAACGGPDGGDDAASSWAREAEAWVTACDDAAASTDGAGSGLYYARDVTVERRDETFEGRLEAAGLDQSLAVTSERHELGPLHLDGSGFLRPESFTWREPGRAPEATLRVWDVGADGVVAVRWYAWAGSPLVVDNPAFDGVRSDVARVADAYVRAWASADVPALRALYAPAATLRDDADGTAATGREAVVALADPRAPPDALLVPAGDVYSADVLAALGASPRAVAVYLSWTFARGDAGDPPRIVLLQRSTAPCPGASAVELVLDDARRVLAERRLRTVSSVRACSSGRPLPTGWWRERGLPAPLSERLTGSVGSPAGPVAIYNGTPELDAFVRWGLDTFAEAGIAPPVVAAVAFDPFAEGCRDVAALTVLRGGSTTITICAEAVDLATGGRGNGPGCSTGCREPPRGRHALLLHELGHAWLIAHTDDATSEAFRALVASPTWSDPATPASERGVEIAAWTLAWGVSGAAAGSSTGRPCVVLAAGYRLLTGAEPVVGCP